MGLDAKEKKFFLDGKEIHLLSGAMHYFRIVPEYWEDRMKRIKACGLNCLETYVPWNLHEEIKGEFNFEGMLDIRRYLQIAQQHGLYVLFRPGPYICSEWEFGGLPSWLLADPQMKVRSSYQPYLNAVDKYLAKLLPLVEDLQYSRGGPIIAVQLENEYGSYGNDLVYKNFLKEKFTEYGITELFFTSDNGTGIQKGQIPNVLVTSNFQEKEHGYLMFEYLRNVKQPDMPHMVMEFWSGWFDHWTEKHHIWPAEEFERVLRWILEQDSSVNFYMFHGGTNFGFMNGANEGLGATNEGGTEPYQADVTSYDYDCQVAENGDLTPKWFTTRKVLQTMLPDQVTADLPEPPPNIPAEAYGDITIDSYMPWNELLGFVQGISSDKILSMEALPINNNGGQSFGFILYRTNVNAVKKLKFAGRVRDRAVILVDGKEVAVVEWTKPKSTFEINLAGDGHVLDILVENMGRVNYADFNSPVLNDQRKGLLEDVLLDGKAVKDWTIFPLEFKKDYIQQVSECDSWKPAQCERAPALYRAKLMVAGEPKDTFINANGWVKGNIFVNGFNIGRYWEKGPQENLYIPGPLLKQGENEILVFALHQPRTTSVSLLSSPSLGETVIHRTAVPTWAKALITVLRTALNMGPWTWKFLRVFLK